MPAPPPATWLLALLASPQCRFVSRDERVVADWTVHSRQVSGAAAVAGHLTLQIGSYVPNAPVTLMKCNGGCSGSYSSCTTTSSVRQGCWSVKGESMLVLFRALLI